MEKAYLGLGTNVGAREKNLREAVDLITDISGIEVTTVSSIYETEPWGYEDQNDFLNLCVELKTELTPQELLASCQEVENKMGRVRKEKWGPRVIDVDILLYDDFKIDTSKLVIPHPRMDERAFVLVPLRELNPNLIIKEEVITELIKEVPTEKVKHYSSY